MIKGFHFWQFIAGITVFIFAMSLIESSLKIIAGRSFKKYLQKHSQNKIKSVAAGTIVTGFLQSSSIALLMTLSFVSAGIMNLRGALAVVLGSNLGSTVSSWIIVLIGFRINLDKLSFPILGIALIGLLLFRKNTKLFHLTNFLIGFSLIFVSLEWLKGCIDNSNNNIITGLGNLYFPWYILIGIFFTALIQSSSITMAITLSALYNNLLPFESAAALVIGSETGTTLKFLISSIGGIPDKKRVAWGNFIVNFVTMIIISIFVFPLTWLIRNQLGLKDELFALVAFQSSINIISILIFFPFLNSFAGFLEKLFKEQLSLDLTKYIHKSQPFAPDDALLLSEKETIHLVNHTIELNKRLLGIHENRRKNWYMNFFPLGRGSLSLTETYNRKKILHGEILEYLTEIPKSEMTDNDLDRIGKLINITRHVIRSAKNLKDIHHDIEEFESTPNDNLFNTLEYIKKSEKEFYSKYSELLKLNPNELTSAIIDDLLLKNRKQYDNSISDTFNMLKEKQISEIDSSTLMNVHREVYSSNKALIEALSELKNL